MPTKELKLILAVALQIAVIFGIIIYKTSIITTGTAIILKTQPVDPRDFLRGDYISLRYEINHLDLNKIEGGEGITFKNGNPVYAELEKIGEYFSVKRISANNPHSKYFIRGRVASNPGGDLTVIYGIEKYFVPEGRGRNLEALLRNRSSGDALLIGVKVNSLGDAVIDKIMIGGKEIDAFDFKKVDAETQVMYDAETKNRIMNNEYEQTRDDSLKENRNEIRRNDLKNIKATIDWYNLTISGTQGHFQIKNMPNTIIHPLSNDRITTFDVPVDPMTKKSYVWIDNTGASSGYCFYAILEMSPVTYYIASSESDVINTAPNAPQTLSDCGAKKSIASIEGYIFIDKNKNAIFDKEDVFFLDVIIEIYKVEIESDGTEQLHRISGMTTKPDQNGHYKFEILDSGVYKIDIRPTISTPIHGIGRSGDGWSKARESSYFKIEGVPKIVYFEIKGGEKITDVNSSIIFD